MNACTWWLGWRNRQCGATNGTRRYLNGLRCPLHAPGSAPDMAGSPANLRADALDAAGHGWAVFPIRPGSKVPALHGVKTCPGSGACAGGHVGWEQRATTDPARVAACWTAGAYNIGIACGPAGLLVVDLDLPKPGKPVNGRESLDRLCAEHGPLPQTWTVTTPSGGVHYYFTAPAGVALRNTAGKLGPGIDTRAQGGLVVAAGSVINGKPYEVTKSPDAIAPLPGWLAELLMPAPLPMQAPVRVAIAADRRSAWLNAAITRQLDYLTSAQPGEQNHALYVSAVALGQLAAGGALTVREVEDLLTQACLSAGLRPKPSTIASGLRAGERRPRRVAS